MRINALRARPRRLGKPKDDDERSVVADNILERDFQADRPNQTWPVGFTYIWTAEGWPYVAAVPDLFSWRVVGWSMTAERDASLVMDALMMAVWRRGKADPLAASLGPGLAIHKRAVSKASGRSSHSGAIGSSPIARGITEVVARIRTMGYALAPEEERPEMTKRKRYSAEFKAKVALEAIREELTTAELAKKYDIHPTMISGWKRTAIGNMAAAFGGGSSAEAPLTHKWSNFAPPRGRILLRL